MIKVYKDDMFPYCPTEDWSCPYYNLKTGRCEMFKKENILPFGECDAFYELDLEEYEKEMGV